MSFDKKFNPLLNAQELIASQFFALKDEQFSKAKLCGGTALARCYLEHRISYDLDFFLPYGFKAQAMAKQLASLNLNFQTTSLIDDPRIANQLHGFAQMNEQTVKLSFIEDAYFETYPVIDKKFGSIKVRTESIEGLYHRKLRTVAGSVAAGDEVIGARQTARDLFDLYVLSKAFMPILAFIASLPYAFPSHAFDNGLAGMPWFELMDELSELIVSPEWQQACDVQTLQTHLLGEIGAVDLEGGTP